MSRFFQTIRFRLTLWNTLVVLSAALLSLFAVREGMRLTFEQEARELLREETTELELAVKELHHDMSRVQDEFERKVLSHSTNDWFASLKNGDQQVIWQSDNFPIELKKADLTKSPGPFEFQQSSQTILASHLATVETGETYLITLGVPTKSIKHDVWKLTKIMLWSGAVLILVAPIGGYFLARHATQPVRNIIKTTQELNPARLDQRLSIRGTNDELDQISHEINLFVDQISRYLESHREFIANAAHELRSPLTAIQTSVEVTLDKNRSDEEYREELETVNEHCAQLRHLVNQLLDLAETDAAGQNGSFVEVDLCSLLQNSINFFAGVAEERQIRLTTELGPRIEVVGNEIKLRQVINNLLDNALKFTPPGGEVIVQLSQTPTNVTFVVSDTGPGIPDSELGKVFDRFYQVDRSRNRDRRNGNGLGLSICKSIVQMHRGSIEATNRSPSGFQVSVRLNRDPKLDSPQVPS